MNVLASLSGKQTFRERNDRLTIPDIFLIPFKTKEFILFFRTSFSCISNPLRVESAQNFYAVKFEIQLGVKEMHSVYKT